MFYCNMIFYKSCTLFQRPVSCVQGLRTFGEGAEEGWFWLQSGSFDDVYLFAEFGYPRAFRGETRDLEDCGQSYEVGEDQ